MTDLTVSEEAAKLHGAVTAWAQALRPAVRSIDQLSDRPHSKPIRDALELAAEHVRVACVLLEAITSTTEPHTSQRTHELGEQALAQRVRMAAL